ncbi:hypothetical protein GOP80_01855 [Planococcaceae bacterium Storch 2/2-2]|nr:hypothetical protein [Planococcaceae bacterium Storch 2/2-2]
MKLVCHAIIIVALVTLTILVYNDGLGAIPFLLAAIYLGTISIFEYRRLKNGKR